LWNFKSELCKDAGFYVAHHAVMVTLCLGGPKLMKEVRIISSYNYPTHQTLGAPTKLWWGAQQGK
jgi:hypothetical protein